MCVSRCVCVCFSSCSLCVVTCVTVCVCVCVWGGGVCVGVCVGVVDVYVYIRNLKRARRFLTRWDQLAVGVSVRLYLRRRSRWEDSALKESKRTPTSLSVAAAKDCSWESNKRTQHSCPTNLNDTEDSDGAYGRRRRRRRSLFRIGEDWFPSKRAYRIRVHSAPKVPVLQTYARSSQE